MKKTYASKENKIIPPTLLYEKFSSISPKKGKNLFSPPLKTKFFLERENKKVVPGPHDKTVKMFLPPKVINAFICEARDKKKKLMCANVDSLCKKNIIIM